MTNIQPRTIDSIPVARTTGADHYFGVTADECYRTFGADCDMNDVRAGNIQTICRTDATRTLADYDAATDRFSVTVYCE